MVRQGYALVACQYENGDILIRAAETVELRESGQCITTLSRIGIPTYQKFLRSLARSTIYRKDGALHIALRRKEGELWGTEALTDTLGADQCFTTGLAAQLF